MSQVLVFAAGAASMLAFELVVVVITIAVGVLANRAQAQANRPDARTDRGERRP